jgi:hypothetical protein
MRAWLLTLPALLALGGCQTHLSLRNNTVKATNTLTDLNYQQVLDNLAMFVANPSAMPSIAVFNSGTVTVADQRAISGNATYAPTITFGQQAGSGLPILSLLLNPSGSRNVTENWSLLPVTDVDNLRRIRCAFQLVVLDGRETTDCDKCADLLRRFYLGETDRMDCMLPTGWFRSGGKKDVPKDACYVGCYCDTRVWVLPDGLEGLTRFTMTVLDLATGKPHAPTRTVVRTYKADGTLDNTQVTTTEVDREALEKWRKEARGGSDRPRMYVNPPAVNPGLFFVPR